MAWLKKLGFAENPFYLYPVPADEKAIRQGFIDRLKELSNADDFVQLRKGKLLVLGRRGEGKSSLLNVFEFKAMQLGKLIIRVDISKTREKEMFLESLLREIQIKIASISDDKKEELDKKLEDLEVIKRKKTKKIKSAAEIEGKIGALLASIRGKIAAEGTKGEEIEYYIAPRIRRLEGIFNEFLPLLFTSFEGILICDNLEKLSLKDFKRFLIDTVQTLPDNILFVTTGDLTKIDAQTLDKCYDVFDIPIMMEKIDKASELRQFIDGRLKAYSLDQPPKISVDQKSIEALMDRTDGNLRECFRYCFFALQKSKTDISDSMITEAIIQCDRPRFEVLDELDKKILITVASLTEADAKTILETIKTEEMDVSTLRRRLDNIANSGFIRKTQIKGERAYRVLYKVPKSVQSALIKYVGE